MKKITLLFFLGMWLTLQSQNKKILFGFDKIPQGLLLNPGAETTYKYHIGVPVLSGVSSGAYVTTISVADVFHDDGMGIFPGTDFNIKLRNAVSRLGTNDYAYVNAQVEVFSAGYKMNRSDYLSVGFYTEADAFMVFPKTLFNLADQGNAAFLNTAIPLSSINVKANVLGVLHAGISRRFSNNFTAGTRLKLYSGALNVTSTGNSGTFTTREGGPNIYEHTVNNLDVGVYSSGIYDENNQVDISTGGVLGKTFLGSNMGVGIDFGFTYHYNQQIEWTASIIDIGFINYSEGNRNAIAKGSYTFSGIDLQYDGQNVSYWSDLQEEIKANIPTEENVESYTVMRPMKFYGAFRYSFGKSRNEMNCHDITFKDFYDSALGGQVYTIFLPNGPSFAFTGFYERKFSKYLNTKFTYTIDDFSASNFGIGLSSNIWKLNVYGTIDNIFSLANIADSNSITFQAGINFIIN